MKRTGPPRRYTPLTGQTPLKRCPLQSRTAPMTTGARRRARRAPDIPAAVRAEVRERSEGVCECGCGRRAEHMHHRKLRSAGGKHELVNLLHLTNSCHRWVHANPDAAYALGLMVHGWADPADVKVQRTPYLKGVC